MDELPFGVDHARLPPGRHGLPRSLVESDQRRRILGAMLRAVHLRGYPETTIGHLVRGAGVSRATFYEHFAGKEECFLATYDLAGQWLVERVERAAAESAEWPVRVRAGASEALLLLAANPEVAHLIAVEAMQAGPAARRRQQSCLSHLAAALRAGRPRRADLPREIEGLLVGGALSLVARYVDDGHSQRLPNATVELVRYLLGPFLAPEETRRIAAGAA